MNTGIIMVFAAFPAEALLITCAFPFTTTVVTILVLPVAGQGGVIAALVYTVFGPFKAIPCRMTKTALAAGWRRRCHDHTLMAWWVAPLFTGSLGATGVDMDLTIGDGVVHRVRRQRRRSVFVVMVLVVSHLVAVNDDHLAVYMAMFCNRHRHLDRVAYRGMVTAAKQRGSGQQRY